MRPYKVTSRQVALIVSVCVVVIPGVSVSAQAPAARTGQEGCWDGAGTPVSCAGTGQDGEIQAGVMWPNPRFTNVGNGTIVDNLTGLSWLQDTGCLSSQTWENAPAEISALNAGSRTCTNYVAGTYGDWRLPNVCEYESLWNYGESGPALADGHPFLNGPGGDYWSSSISVKFYWIHAWRGYSADGEVEYGEKDQTRNVWAVRGPVTGGPAPVAKTGQQECWDSGGVIPCAGTGQDGEIQAGVAWPSPRFSDLGNGTVVDNLTGLIWLQDAQCFGWNQWTTALSEVAALNAGTRTCVNYTPGSFGDWRLANIREITSLWDYGRIDPALPEGYPFVNVVTPGTNHWTSSTVVGSPDRAWKAETYSGRAITDTKSTYWHVWPVRGGTLNAIFADDFESGDTSAWTATIP